MTFDPTKPVQTRNGLNAVLWTEQQSEAFGKPLIGLVRNRDGSMSLRTWYLTGAYACDSEKYAKDLDLINIPTTRWAALYENTVHYYDNKKLAREVARENDAIAVVEFQDGDGL